MTTSNSKSNKIKEIYNKALKLLNEDSGYKITYDYELMGSADNDLLETLNQKDNYSYNIIENFTVTINDALLGGFLYSLHTLLNRVFTSNNLFNLKNYYDSKGNLDLSEVVYDKGLLINNDNKYKLAYYSITSRLDQLTDNYSIYNTKNIYIEHRLFKDF